MKHINKHNHIDDCKSKSHNHSNNECDKKITKNTDNKKVSVSENKHKDSSSSDPDEDEPESSKDSERSTVEVHHHHHHDHNKKPENIVLKFFWYILVGLGLIVIEGDEECGIGHEDHDHSAFATKRWILALGSFITFFAFFNLFDGIIGKELVEGELIPVYVFPLLDKAWVQLTLGIIVFIIMGLAFIKGSTKSLMNKEIAEDTLVAIATTTAFVYSIFAMIYNGAVGLEGTEALPYLFYEGIEIWVLIYLGRFIEEWLINRVSGEMNALESLKPKAATILRGNEEIVVNINEVVIGDTLLIKPGEVIPVDGKVTFGETTIDESSLTGESLPITKRIGSKVFGGTISSNGMIHIIVEKLIGDSFISKIIDGVKEASKTKPASQRMADKIASYLVPSVLAIALLTFIITAAIVIPQDLLTTSFKIEAILFPTITVMVIACPCSFAMTTPMSVLISSTVAKKESVLFSSKSIFETIKKIDVICFDKTGTLTEGKFEVVETTLDKDILSLVVNAERNSNHPLASSIVKHFEELKSNKVITKEIVGRGLEIQNSGKSIFVGSLNFAKEKNKNFDENEDIINKRKNGSAIIYAFSEDEVYGYIELKDEVKQSTLNTLSEIRKMGIEIVMITGDNRNTANHIGSSLGISDENIYADVLPDKKSDIIKQLQEKGMNVAFVGDGINDSIALKQANIGIAMGEGSDAAIDSADIVLNKEDMTLISYSIWLSRKTLFNVKRGFTIAIVYNIIAVPLAASGILPPAAGALSMVFNDSVAMLNAMTLSDKTKKKFDKKDKKR